MKNEILKSTEFKRVDEQGSTVSFSKLNQEGVDALYTKRLEDLERVKELVSLKFVHLVEEKLLAEKKTLEKLLNLQSAEDAARAKYSFVLSSYFFDQKFFGER